MRTALIFISAALGCFAHSQEFVIVGAKAYLGNGKSIENARIVVRNGRIESIDRDSTVPSGMVSVDAKGLVAYPGFIDAYSTKGLKIPAAPDPAPGPNTTSTAPATMWIQNRKGVRGRVNAADCLNLSAMLDDAHKAGFTCALLSPGSGIVRGRSTVVNLTEDAKGTPFAVELSYRGTGGGGFGGGGGGAPSTAYSYPGTLLGYVALLRQTLFDTQTYMAASSPKEDPDLKGIVPLFQPNGMALIAADTDPDIYRSLQLADEFKFKFAIIGGRDAYKRADQLAKLGIPVAANISTGSEPSVTPQPDGPPQAVLEERRELYRIRSRNVLELMKAKVQVAFSSEGSGYSDFLSDVRKLIQTGVTPAQALESMTSIPAKLLGVDKEQGSLEKGKMANIVLMTGELQDEKATVKTVFVAGKKFEVAK